MIETRLIHYFLAVAREESITGAANALHITQPTLSKQMMELEKQLGCQLFIRNKKRIVLTEEGHYFRRRGQEILELMASTEAALRSNDQVISGEINLGCGETTHMDRIASEFAKLHTLYPEVRLNLYSGNTEALLERMDKGLVDISLLLNPPVREKYDYTEIGRSDQFGLLMRKDDPIANRESVPMEELKKLPLIMSMQTFSRFEQPSFPLNSSDMNIISYYNLIYNASFLVEQKIGYAFTLEGLINPNGRNLTFRPIDPPIIAPWVLVTKKYEPQSPAVRAFLEMFRHPDT